MVDPLNPDPRANPTPPPSTDPRVDNRTVVQSRGSGTSVMISAVVIILAIVAYFMFAGNKPATTPEATPPATTSEPATPPATSTPAPTDTAPTTTEPAAPAPTTTPAPTDSAPAAPTTPPAQPAPAQ
jgi:cytoskeletal protein RodZ